MSIERKVKAENPHLNLVDLWKAVCAAICGEQAERPKRKSKEENEE